MPKPCNIFYSWQSDLPNSINRGFIQGCLERAAKSIRQDDSIAVEPVIDRDTQNVSGAPNISETIFKKIEATDGFVCDVSFINYLAVNADGNPSRLTPNPNVLIELGYATHALTWDRVILVMNTAFAPEVKPIEELPFDLRQRRVIPYHLSPKTTGEEKATVRQQLQATLEFALRDIATQVEAGPEREQVRRAIDALKRADVVLTGLMRECCFYAYSVITPWDKRPSDAHQTVVSLDFKFSDMRDLFKASLRIIDGQQPVVLSYLRIQEALRNASQDILLNVDLSHFPQLSVTLLHYLQLSYLNLSEGITYESTATLGNGRKLKDLVEEIISENEEPPTVKGANIIDKYVILYELIRLTLTYIRDYDKITSSILGLEKQALGITIE